MAAVFMSLFLLNLLASGSSAPDAQQPRNSTLHRLTRHLLRNYSKGVRPVRNWSKATTIYLDLFLHAVLDVDTENQKLTTSIWFQQMGKDDLLTWNSSLYGGIRETSLPLSAIWSPDIVINEFVDVSRSPELPYVFVNAAGMIKNYQPLQAASACRLEMCAFPLDAQNCSLTFSSIWHTVQDVDLALWRSHEDIQDDQMLFLDDGEWELLSLSSHPRVLCMETGRFAQIQFNPFVLGFRVFKPITSIWALLCLTFSLTWNMVVIRRRPLLYVVSLLIPSLFLMLIDLASFYLPPNCGTRITFKTSVLVGYTVFQVNMSDKLLGSAISSPLIGVFFTVCMAFLVLSLSKSVLLLKFLHTGEDPVRERLFSCCWAGSAFDRGGPGEDSQASREIPGVLRNGEKEEVKGEGSWTVTSTQMVQLEKILAQLLLIRSQLHALDGPRRLEVNWLMLSSRLDRRLFWAYVLTLGVYAVTLCSRWLVWSWQ